VDADRARAHVQALAAAGIGWRQAADLAGIPRGTMQDLLHGGGGRRHPSERLRPETEAAILAVQPAPENLAAGTPVAAAGTHRRLQALVANGWSQARLGERLGMTPANFATMMRQGQVRAGTARAAAAVYDELWNRPAPETTHHEKAAASRARNHAKASGWAPPLAWDEERIDAPDGRPADDWQRTASTRRSAAELAEEAADVMTQGHTIDQAAERLGVTRSAIEHATQRARFATASAAAKAHEIEREAG
jgi:transcriptional regulator with XRE-family HTH domain